MKSERSNVKRIDLKKKIVIIISIAISLYLLFLIPTEIVEPPKLADKKQFVWNRDSIWNTLEKQYAESKNKNPLQLNSEINKQFKTLNSLLEIIKSVQLNPSDKKFTEFENQLFYTAALIGAQQNFIHAFIDLYSKIRAEVKMQSINWDLNEPATKQTLYKLLYGGRAAVEELLLQASKNKIPDLIFGKDEKSSTPQSLIKGLIVHSGDILVSRGGAPTSALIARGNDYPGNFSHIALVYVDDKSGKTFVVESHIEKGVTLSSIEDYLNDKKLRIMVLRFRADNPKIIEDKMLPHKAAKWIYDRASTQHIAYDFSMDYKDSEELFCSEVASSAYKNFGINLWTHLSSISTNGTANWLAGFGVKNFVTQEPSDLEYDPQLSVVAEWRDKVTLFQDHIDNAIIDAMLEQAEAGKKLVGNWYLLPVARTLKLYSLVLNLFDKVGPVPEGMSPESALRHKKIVSLHEEIKTGVDMKVKDFIDIMKYNPPYWKLVSFARKTISEKKLF